MARHDEFTRDMLLDVCGSLLDTDLNDPLPSIADLSDAQLNRVREGLLAWRRINTVLDCNGVLDERAAKRVSTMPSHHLRSLIQGGSVMDTRHAAEQFMDQMKGTSEIVHLDGTSGKWPEDEIVHTGSLELDLATGIGGIPRGRVVEIYGAESSGKSSLMMTTCGEAQKAGMLVLYMDAENSFDPVYARHLGMDTSTAMVNYPSSLQEAIETMRKAMRITAGDSMPDLLIVVDSVPALPAIEMEDADARKDQFRALNARHWSQWMPKLVSEARASHATLMLINQTRTAQSMYQKLSDTTPGGKAIKFAASLRFEISRRMSEALRDSRGQDTTVKIVKNKVGSPFKSAEYFLWANTGIDPVEDTFTSAVKAGVIRKDVKLDAGKEKACQNWYMIPLRSGWLDLLRADEKDRQSVDPETGEIVESSVDVAEVWPDGTSVAQQFHKRKMIDFLSDHPRLVQALRGATLDTLGSDSRDGDFSDASLKYQNA